MSEMHHIRRGNGRPLLLVHGLGGNVRSFDTILNPLAGDREVIAVDLPGFGQTPPLDGEVSIRTLADALAGFIAARQLTGIDAVGSSMGARLVLELARRGGVLGAVVSLDPGGFWRGWERHAFHASMWLSIRLVRALEPGLPRLTTYGISRKLLLLQFAERPWTLAPKVVLNELRSHAASPSFGRLLHEMAYGEEQQGAPSGSIRSPLVIGWGRQDRVCFPRQAKRAQQMFPDARLHWFEHCGHFPHWDAPEETVRLILATTRAATDPRIAGTFAP